LVTGLVSTQLTIGFVSQDGGVVTACDWVRFVAALVSTQLAIGFVSQDVGIVTVCHWVRFVGKLGSFRRRMPGRADDADGPVRLDPARRIGFVAAGHDGELVLNRPGRAGSGSIRRRARGSAWSGSGSAEMFTVACGTSPALRSGEELSAFDVQVGRCKAAHVWSGRGAPDTLIIVASSVIVRSFSAEPDFGGRGLDGTGTLVCDLARFTNPFLSKAGAPLAHPPGSRAALECPQSTARLPPCLLPVLTSGSKIPKEVRRQVSQDGREFLECSRRGHSCFLCLRS
jgi:hypothetical protein